MDAMTLIIGSKNTSSWSLRPWLAMKQAGLAFDEELVPLRRDDTKAEILKRSPSGKVPVLRHDGLLIWDSLAICEYIHELAPRAGLWPQDHAARATARAVSAEMHAGFQALRRVLPMDILVRHPLPCLDEEVQSDIRRITESWRDCRARFGQGGPFLFGSFTIADAMYAPVASRFETYGVPLAEDSAAYVRAVLSLSAMEEWRQGCEPLSAAV